MCFHTHGYAREHTHTYSKNLMAEENLMSDFEDVFQVN